MHVTVLLWYYTAPITVIHRVFTGCGLPVCVTAFSWGCTGPVTVMHGAFTVFLMRFTCVCDRVVMMLYSACYSNTQGFYSVSDVLYLSM